MRREGEVDGTGVVTLARHSGADTIDATRYQIASREADRHRFDVDDDGDDTAGPPPREHDIVALGIAIAAILLFVALGGQVVPHAVNAMIGEGRGPDQALTSALLLNIALVIFGWRRYRDLTSEIVKRRASEHQARALAETDPLTGCLNRRSMDKASNRLQQVANNRGLAVAYCMLDLDNFKQINDLHGHALGDAVLVQLADRIRDALPKDALLARLGGDEFAFITSFDPAARERIDDLIARLYDIVLKPFDNGDASIDASVSIGIATDHDEHGFDPLMADAAALMQRADIAMYQAKKEGKNRYFWFEAAMENELRFRNELEIGIRQGIAAGEFVPYYEQQVDLESGELVGFEMLARWHSPKLGRVSPEIFIPIAEDIGLIGALSEYLMQRAFADANEWNEALSLAINISPVQLRDPWFAQKLLKLLVESGFPAHRLEIEITESCLHENLSLVRSIITSLRNQGVRVSIDDFGTGYSSFEQLRSLPFDRIKIDRSFVAELSDPNSKSQIVEAIISLGRGLDLPVTAEGIEDDKILDVLRDMGRLKGQGYHYGQPETAEEVRARLTRSDQLSGSGRRRTETAEAMRSPSAPPGAPGAPGVANLQVAGSKAT